MALLVLLLSFSFTSAWADPDRLLEAHHELLEAHGVGKKDAQAFCYLKEGRVEGHRVEAPQRIASVTKLFTTYLVSEVLDLKKTYLTKIHVSANELHLEGGRDPYFEEEKLLLLFQALNQLGYRSFKRVTFDRNFLFSDALLGQHEDLGPEHTRQRLAHYLSSSGKKTIRTAWKRIREFAEEEGVRLEEDLPALTSPKVVLVNSTPELVSPAVFVHESRPLHRIIKSMNVMSKNLVAQNLYLEAKEKKDLMTLLQEKGIDTEGLSIRNGSGLPLKTGGKRFDNQATCSAVVKLIQLLGARIHRLGFEPSDIFAVNGGYDLGSFRTRFLGFPETHLAVFSKTGTVNKTSSLAGFLSVDELQPFAVLNHTENVAAARRFQDEFVARMFDHDGGARPLPYDRISIFPWDGEAFLEASSDVLVPVVPEMAVPR